MKILPVLCAGLCLLTSACVTATPQDYLKMHDIAPPTPQNFTHCYDYGCQTKVTLSLPETTQRSLYQIFTPPPQNAAQEREKISKAIGRFETDIGQITGTKNDKYGTFRLYQDGTPESRRFQQDCVDESTNTTTYLSLLHQMGLLHFHSPSFPSSRQPFLSGGSWWHQSATIKDNKTGRRYAVDSWFDNNGHPAHIVTLDQWHDGWKPTQNE